jgi:hypothetical protein
MNMQSDNEPMNNTETEENQVQLIQSEENQEINTDETSFPDVSNYTKEELLSELKGIVINPSELSKLAGFLRELKEQFDNSFESDKQEVLQSFIQEGGNKDDFHFKKDETSLAFENEYNKIRNQVSEKISTLGQEKENNFKKKTAILESLREITSGEETSASLNTFKELQADWKNIGQVPSAKSQDLWANYNALVEMFYNNRSIYFELKELDRKKNLDSKNEIIERCEQLVSLENISEAIKELKKLHEEYKLIGPVPKEDQEELWNRFKAASDKVYENRNILAAKNKVLHEENLVKKRELLEKLRLYEEFTTDSINLWKDKTKEVLELQNQWKSIGPVPKSESNTISKDFWASYKVFFKNKDLFFKELEAERLQNLEKKVGLCEQVEKLKDSTDLIAATNTIKRLQAEWSKIGPVPKADNAGIYKRFKEASDYVFNLKRAQHAEQEQEFLVNLDAKLAVIDKINALANNESKNLEDIRELQVEFNAIGFIPKTEIEQVRNAYKLAVENFIKSIDSVEGDNKDNLILELEVSALKSDPNAKAKLQKKEGDMYRKIQGLKSDIQTWTTNIDFLANSPKADKLKDQIQQSIDNAKTELVALEAQLNIIKNTI